MHFAWQLHAWAWAWDHISQQLGFPHDPLDS